MTATRRYAPSPARAQAIRDARAWAWMSEEDLARAVGVTRGIVRAWEAGRRDPGPVYVMRVAAATRVPVSLLLIPGRQPIARDGAAAGWPLDRRQVA